MNGFIKVIAQDNPDLFCLGSSVRGLESCVLGLVRFVQDSRLKTLDFLKGRAADCYGWSWVSKFRVLTDSKRERNCSGDPNNARLVHPFGEQVRPETGN